MTDPVITAPQQTTAITTTPGFVGQILNTLLNPSTAMAAVPQQSGRHFWLLAIQLLLTTAIIYWFYAGMSPAWLVDQQMLHAGELTPAETEQIRAAMAGMAGATPIIGAVSVAVGSLAFTAITAGYLLLTGKLQKALNYGQWFALVVWSQLPALLNIVGLALLVLLANSPDQPLMLVNYASLNQLVLDLPVGHALYTWAESINVFLIWQLWILFAGLQSAASFSSKRAAIVTGTPVLLIFGLWALLA
ncbi:MAG: YIP1 family protein [Rheinheimera sp.]|nr:YIP1 family protein [Rheinheimera sp.]